MIRLSRKLIFLIGITGIVSCHFPGEAITFDIKGNGIELTQLKKGDKVMNRYLNGTIFEDEVLLVDSKPETEEFAYLEFYYQHPDSKKKKEFLPIYVSPNHLMLRGPTGLDSARAKEVQVGNTVLLYIGGYTPILLKKVVVKKGGFSPVTKSGRILINGVLMSCYEDLPSHLIAHMIYFKLRKWGEHLPYLTNIWEKKVMGTSVMQMTVKTFNWLIKKNTKHKRETDL